MRPGKLKNQKHRFVTSNALLASYQVSYRIAKCKKPYTIGEILVLPAAIDVVKVMFGEHMLICCDKYSSLII